MNSEISEPAEELEPMNPYRVPASSEEVAGEQEDAERPLTRWELLKKVDFQLSQKFRLFTIIFSSLMIALGTVATFFAFDVLLAPSETLSFSSRISWFQDILFKGLLWLVAGLFVYHRKTWAVMLGLGLSYYLFIQQLYHQQAWTAAVTFLLIIVGHTVLSLIYRVNKVLEAADDTSSGR